MGCLVVNLSKDLVFSDPRDNAYLGKCVRFFCFIKLAVELAYRWGRDLDQNLSGSLGRSL